MPLTSAALGGLVGVTLWFRGRIFTVASVLATLGMFAAMGLMDLLEAPLFLQLGLYLLIAAIALIALRVGIQSALMHEELDPADPSGRLTLSALRPHRPGYGVLPELRSRRPCGVAEVAQNAT